MGPDGTRQGQDRACALPDFTAAAHTPGTGERPVKMVGKRASFKFTNDRLVTPLNGPESARVLNFTQFHDQEPAMSKAPIVNIRDLAFVDIGDGGRFEARLGRIGSTLGARDLGFNVTVVPPGKRAFPYHLHHGIEEMFFILEGEGTLRYRGEEFALRKGDFIACPTGPAGGHQIINSGTDELKYLAVSTVHSPDIVEYPDSGKVGAVAGDFASPEFRMDFRLFVKKESGVDFYEGESD